MLKICAKLLKVKNGHLITLEVNKILLSLAMENIKLNYGELKEKVCEIIKATELMYQVKLILKSFKSYIFM